MTKKEKPEYDDKREKQAEMKAIKKYHTKK